MSNAPTDYTTLDDAQLLSQCDVHIFKSSGPGGQHRNKVSSAVRLRHRPTELSALGDESRSQHQNKRMAVRRLRMKIALGIRRPIPKAELNLPPIVSQCIFRPRGRGSRDVLRLEIGRKDHRFWSVMAFSLDVLEAFEGRLSDAAAYLGISTSNLASVLKSERHLFAAAQGIRKRFNHTPLK